MIWKQYGATAARSGMLNINSDEAAKRCGGLYARQDCFGFMIIFGKDEREKVEAIRDHLSGTTLMAYDSADCVS